jgi:transaldolase
LNSLSKISYFRENEFMSHHTVSSPPPESQSERANSGTYLQWLIKNTKTTWWHDSADPAELQLGLERGATGVTTNPFLSNLALVKSRTSWMSDVDRILSMRLSGEEQAEALMNRVVLSAAKMYQPIYGATGGEAGYVCAQVNPSRAGDRESMMAMARRFHSWAPNIAVKLPAVSAGLDVLEECVAEGITATATVSFSVPQVIAIAERCRAGRKRAAQNRVKPGKCFSVIMIGRLDDYLSEVSRDNRAEASESDIRQSGLAVAKRAFRIYQEMEYEAVLLIAALRGSYHLTELAGADLIMSIAPAAQKWFVEQDYPREQRVDREIAPDVLQRLLKMPEFVRAFEPGGMKPADFISFGPAQRTLCQFIEAGWKLLESFR